MKKILNIIILFAAVVFCGCSDFDDSELRGRIDGYKNRIEALKAKAETLGKQLADLSYLTNGNVITTVSTPTGNTSSPTRTTRTSNIRSCWRRWTTSSTCRSSA